MIQISDEEITQREVDLIVSWLNDKELMKYSEQRHSKHTQASQLKYIYNISGLDQYKKITLEGNCIGTVTAYIDEINDVANVGILIGSPYIGKGYGCIAWGMFCNRLRQHKIESGCMAKNNAMIRIFEKNGMRLEGTRKYHFWTGKDQYDHMVMYGMLT